MSIPTLTLASGDQLPVMGLGLWKIDRAETARVVHDAIKVGYRHIDAACDYGNESEAGMGISRAIADGLCSRDELWVTSKLWNTYHAPAHVRAAAEKSLSDLQVDTLDLYLIHFPIALQFVPFDKNYPPGWFADPTSKSPRMEPSRIPISETWGAMEELVRAGLVKNIGVCNFGCSLIRDLLSYATISSAVLQVELHPYLVQDKLVRFCNENRIAVTAFSPLGAQSYFSIGMASPEEAVLEQPEVKRVAAEHDCTPAQVVLRWGTQRGTAVIPKTSRHERLKENLASLDIDLTNAEMGTLSALDRHQRFNDPGVFCESAFNTFFPIYE